MNVKEFNEAFDKKHGDFVVYGEQILYQDGAMRECSVFGLSCEPPKNPVKCQELIIRFWELKLGLAVEEFVVRKHMLLRRAKAAALKLESQVSDEEVLFLKELQKKVRDCLLVFISPIKIKSYESGQF